MTAYAELLTAVRRAASMGAVAEVRMRPEDAIAVLGENRLAAMMREGRAGFAFVPARRALATRDQSKTVLRGGAAATKPLRNEVGQLVCNNCGIVFEHAGGRGRPPAFCVPHRPKRYGR